MCAHTCRWAVLQAGNGRSLLRDVFLSKWKIEEDPFYLNFISLFSVFVIFKSPVDNCQQCILLEKWFQTYIHSSNRESLKRL